MLDGLQASGECAFELLRSDFGLIQSLGLDEVANGFGLSEVDAAVEEGAHGELAGFGKARAPRKGEFDDMSQHDRRAVGRDLHDVIGGVGVRLLKETHDDFIDAGILYRSLL